MSEYIDDREIPQIFIFDQISPYFSCCDIKTPIQSLYSKLIYSHYFYIMEEISELLRLLEWLIIFVSLQFLWVSSQSLGPRK